jgi:hypothetical protein
MFGFFKKRLSDEQRASEFVRHIFVLGRETCSSVGKAIKMIPPGDVSVPVTDEASLEVSLAILGTSLAILKGRHSKIMLRDRGTEIDAWCKKSIEHHYDSPLKSSSELVETIEEYQAAFERAMHSNINPFGEISGIILVRLLGPRVKSFYVRGTTALDPILHQIVGDLMTMTTTQALNYWKD